VGKTLVLNNLSIKNTTHLEVQLRLIDAADFIASGPATCALADLDH
jgi:hypothetical protein